MSQNCSDTSKEAETMGLNKEEKQTQTRSDHKIYKKINKLSVLNNFTFTSFLWSQKKVCFVTQCPVLIGTGKLHQKGDSIELLNHKGDTNLLVGSFFITYKNIFWAMLVSIVTILPYVKKNPYFAWKSILSNKQTQNFHKTITSDIWPWNTKILLMQNVYY